MGRLGVFFWCVCVGYFITLHSPKNNECPVKMPHGSNSERLKAYEPLDSLTLVLQDPSEGVFWAGF